MGIKAAIQRIKITQRGAVAPKDISANNLSKGKFEIIQTFPIICFPFFTLNSIPFILTFTEFNIT
jgi:hypothetical protein